MNVPVLAIVGSSNSGKTTLLEKLIAALTYQGLRIATIKHSHHQPEMDTPGKDSWRHKQAGALASLLVGSEKMLMVTDLPIQPTPRQLADAYFSDYDLILVEGYASVPGPKIEVLRSGCSSSLRCEGVELIAVATDIPELNVSVPLFDMNDVRALITFILHWMKSKKGG